MSTCMYKCVHREMILGNAIYLYTFIDKCILPKCALYRYIWVWRDGGSLPRNHLQNVVYYFVKQVYTCCAVVDGHTSRKSRDGSAPRKFKGGFNEIDTCVCVCVCDRCGWKCLLWITEFFRTDGLEYIFQSSLSDFLFLIFLSDIYEF